MAAIGRVIRDHPAMLAALAAGILAGAASFGPGSAVADLGWRAGGGTGASWRLLTAHFVHLGAAHLAANIFAATLIGWSCDQLGVSARLPAAALASLAGVGLGLEFGPWAITWYVGLSGLLHGLFAWLCLSLALSPPAERSPGMRKLAAALYLGGLLKVVVALATPLGAPGWLGIPQATPAHLYGYLGGTLWAFLRRER
jgi:rhomboid family GlyGly-CTERM serine protease